MTKRRLVITAGAALAVVALVVGAVLVIAADDDPVAATCDNALSVYFADDEDMRAAAGKLRDDDRVGEVRTETRAQAQQRLDARFPDDNATGPATHYAAAVHLTADGVDNVTLATDLRREVPAARTADAVDCPPQPLSKPEDVVRYVHRVACSHVNVSFNRDEDMQAAAGKLRGDKRVKSVETSTKAESYVQARELFKDEPELLEALTPESVPAMVQLIVRDDPEELAGSLGAELTGVRQAEPMPCLALPHPVADRVR